MIFIFFHQTRFSRNNISVVRKWKDIEIIYCPYKIIPASVYRSIIHFTNYTFPIYFFAVGERNFILPKRASNLIADNYATAR